MRKRDMWFDIHVPEQYFFPMISQNTFSDNNFFTDLFYSFTIPEHKLNKNDSEFNP